MNASRLTFHILLAALVLIIGCASPIPAKNPLAGWTFRTYDDFLPFHSRRHYQLNHAITDDYNDFLTKNNLTLFNVIMGFFEDGTGKHAVEFDAFPPDQNATWHYVLIYDKENKRIKVMKYGYRRFQS